MESKQETAEQKRRHVLNSLRSFPICDVFDLARCAPDVWASLSRELGGVSHGVVMSIALRHVTENLPRKDRAAFWQAVNLRQSNVGQGCVLYFPGDRHR